MACDAATLINDARCVAAAMGSHQILASILVQLATTAGASTDPATLIANSKCIAQAMGDHQLMAAIVYLQCQINGS